MFPAFLCTTRSLATCLFITKSTVQYSILPPEDAVARSLRVSNVSFFYLQHKSNKWFLLTPLAPRSRPRPLGFRRSGLAGRDADDREDRRSSRDTAFRGPSALCSLSNIPNSIYCNRRHRRNNARLLLLERSNFAGRYGSTGRRKTPDPVFPEKLPPSSPGDPPPRPYPPPLPSTLRALLIPFLSSQKVKHRSLVYCEVREMKKNE